MTALTRPLFKYFGSKWRTAKHYPKPKFDLIIEPFAGSACYSCQYPEREVVLVDKDPDVIELWNYLISADPAEILSLPTDSLRAGEALRDLGLSNGAVLLISRWQHFGSSACKTVGKWHNILWDDGVKRSIVENLPKIRHWKAICGDYESIENRRATWFCDPPYQHVRGYKYDLRQINFGDLSKWCQSRNGQTIVCEQLGADWLPFENFHLVLGGHSKKGVKRQKKQEVIWTRDEQ